MKNVNNSLIDVRTALYAAFVLRVSLGVVFIAHALLKVLVFTLPGTAQFFTAHGFPGWSAYPVFAAELIGGLALVVGFHARVASVALIPIMAGAFLVHWPNGWIFTAPNGGWGVRYISARHTHRAGAPGRRRFRPSACAVAPRN